MKEFECGLLGGLLCTGKHVVDQVLIVQGDGDLGECVELLKTTASVDSRPCITAGILSFAVMLYDVATRNLTLRSGE